MMMTLEVVRGARYGSALQLGLGTEKGVLGGLPESIVGAVP